MKNSSDKSHPASLCSDDDARNANQAPKPPKKQPEINPCGLTPPKTLRNPWKLISRLTSCTIVRSDGDARNANQAPRIAKNLKEVGIQAPPRSRSRSLLPSPALRFPCTDQSALLSLSTPLLICLLADASESECSIRSSVAIVAPPALVRDRLCQAWKCGGFLLRWRCVFLSVEAVLSLSQCESTFANVRGSLFCRNTVRSSPEGRGVLKKQKWAELWNFFI
jgi:hypothetical protein